MDFGQRIFREIDFFDFMSFFGVDFFKLSGLLILYFFSLHELTEGQKILKSPGKKLAKSKIFFREIAFLAVLNFVQIQKLIIS